jgi:hypothetical protein
MDWPHIPSCGHGRLQIVGGFCWFKRLPMANDGNTVKAIYVSLPISPADVGHAVKRHCSIRHTQLAEGRDSLQKPYL